MSDQRTGLSQAAIRHPDFLFDSTEWAEWRATFSGGKQYRNQFLKKWSDRETPQEFALRCACTPIPTFAKAAILDIRNAIFQRLGDVLRIGGAQSYQTAVEGEGIGVDREGTGMNQFIGVDVLTELLVMGRAGVYVDAPNTAPTTIAQQVNRPDLAPYVYCYRIEDILSWTLDFKEVPGTFKAVLLRDHFVQMNRDFGDIELPEGRESRLRLVWRGEDGKVRVKFFTDAPKDQRKVIFVEGSDAEGTVKLDIDIIPFVMPDIGDSLMKDIASYQHALLNLVSGDVNWSLQSSSPFLTIQRDLRSVGAHLKDPGQGNSPEAGGQRAQSKEEQIGGKGRYYDMDADRPGYIAPPTDPLMASMKLQEKLEDDIRKLVNLAVANKAGSRTESAEAKKLSSQGLDAGLSYIGLVLEDTERHIAKFWSMYEPSGGVPKVAYPARYILKQDIERIEEAKEMAGLMDRLPSRTARKSLAKQIVITMLGGKEDVGTINTMLSEIDRAGYTTGAVQDVIQAHSAGLVSDKTASESLGYDPSEIEQARQDKADRAAITLLAQTAVAEGESGNTAIAQSAENAGARGVPDIDPNEDSAEEEKEESEDDA